MKKAKASIWQHLSFVVLMWYLTSTFILNAFFFVKEDVFNSVIDTIYEICYVFRICITDFVFLRPTATSGEQTTRTIVVIVTLVLCLLLMYLATLIYKKHSKTIIQLFIVLVFVDFIATILFMVVPMWLALSLKAILIIFLFLAMATAKHENS